MTEDPFQPRAGFSRPFFWLRESKDNKSQSAVWAYKVDEDAWYRVNIHSGDEIESLAGSGQNRAMVYDPKHDLVLLVVGSGGDDGKASVYALRYRHERARVASSR